MYLSTQVPRYLTAAPGQPAQPSPARVVPVVPRRVVDVQSGLCGQESACGFRIGCFPVLFLPLPHTPKTTMRYFLKYLDPRARESHID